MLGTQILPAAPRPLLAGSLPYAVVARGPTWPHIPDQLRHQFQFTLYATALDQLLDTPVFHFTDSLPKLAGKKLTLSFAPASQADATLIASYLPQPPADGSPIDPRALPASLPGYLLRLIAELRVEGQVVASGGPFTMGQALISTIGLADPKHGWEEIENLTVAGEYQALAIDTVGITLGQVQALQATLDTTQAKLAAHDLTSLTAEELIGDMLYSAVLSYFAANDRTEQLDAALAGLVAYRLPSFGRFTLVAQPQYWFGIPRTVTFPGLEMDIDRLMSIAVSKENKRAVQVAHVQQSGLRQSAYEHLIPELLFPDAQHSGLGVSAVKALSLAHAQGQRLYTITLDNVVAVLPQLQLTSDVVVEIQEAVATGKQVLVSERPVTVGEWTGIGYIILDHETGTGAYKISGGANGGVVLGVLFGMLFLHIMVAVSVGSVNPAVLVLGLTALVPVSIAMTLVVSALRDDQQPCFWAGFGAVLALGAILLTPELAPVAQVVFIRIMALIGLEGFLGGFGGIVRCATQSQE